MICHCRQAPLFTNTSQCRAFATQAWLCLYSPGASLLQSLSRWSIASPFFLHIRGMGLSPFLPILYITALVLNGCIWAATSNPSVSSLSCSFCVHVQFAPLAILSDSRENWPCDSFPHNSAVLSSLFLFKLVRALQSLAVTLILLSDIMS